MRKNLIFTFLLLFAALLNAQQVPPDSSRIKVFELGEVVIADSTETAVPTELDARELQTYNLQRVSTVLDLLPGISLAAAGARNEAMLYIRGYDLRQVPVFIDGVPVYVPYDGYIDLARLQTANAAKISVSKGFSSMLYGANSMGGVINIVTRKPIEKFEVNGQTGTKLSSQGNNSYNTSLNIGSRLDKWYFEGNVSLLDRDFMSLPSSFDTTSDEADQERDNSYSKDFQYQAKAGFVPEEGYEYVIGYSGIRAKKGVPVYIGNNPDTRVRYWQYPDWDKHCIYFHSKTTISRNYILKARLFYDKYYNVLKSFDDNTYRTQTRRSAFTSIYDDKSYGGAVELGIYSIKDNELKFAINTKYDHHQEYDEGETPRDVKDNTLVIAVEDVWNVSPKVTLVGGVGYFTRFGIDAEDYDAENDLIYLFNTADDKAFNAQAGLYYKLKEGNTLYATVARKSRFATMKDRYSYRMGSAIPNPDLESELSVNTEIGYKGSTKSLQWSAAGYYYFISNTIQQVDNVEPGIYQLQNTGESKFRGFELSGGWKFNELFIAGASYSFIDQKNDTNTEFKFVNVPKSKVTGYLKAEKINQFYAMLNVICHSESHSTSDGMFKASSFAVLSFDTEYFLVKYISVKASVHNLLDELYYYDEGYPEEGRAFNLAVTYRFSK